MRVRFPLHLFLFLLMLFILPLFWLPKPLEDKHHATESSFEQNLQLLVHAAYDCHRCMLMALLKDTK